MNKLLGIAIATMVVGIAALFALSPYFTESTIDEAIPTGAIIQSVENKNTVASNQDDTMMEEEMIKDDTMMEEEMISLFQCHIGVHLWELAMEFMMHKEMHTPYH